MSFYFFHSPGKRGKREEEGKAKKGKGQQKKIG